MLKYAKKTGEHTYDVGLGTSKASEDFYKLLGMVQTDVEQGADGNWYDVGFAPKEKPIADQIVELDVQYDREKTELANYFLEATIAGDTDLQAELKAEIEQLNADYDEKRRELEGE